MFYHYDNPPLNGVVWLAGAGLAVITAVALGLRKRPYVAVGWFWYAGMLVPVIGLVQVGVAGDGGPLLVSAWPSACSSWASFGISELAAHFRHGKAAAAVLAGLALAGCLVVTRRQVACWRNSETLFRHAIAVTRKNYAAYNNLGIALSSRWHG